ncbi:MAG: cyclase family protein [Acidobacteria bacterium]|jgi:kynurenine formamidase|nr:cyclase family protein [Acidobacteriota bacterium]
MNRPAPDVIDLTHAISADMPVFPGTEAPRLDEAYTIERNGFAEKMLHLVSHTGTHIDAPGHIVPGATRLDGYPAGRFLGPAVAMDVSAVRGRGIEIVDIAGYEARLRGADFALLHTGWAGYWGFPEYFGSYPVLSAVAAQWLAGLGLKGFGVDTISVDVIDSSALPVHRAIFAANMVIIENLADMKPLLDKEFVFSCLPLKIVDADGSPIRAVAVVPPAE